LHAAPGAINRAGVLAPRTEVQEGLQVADRAAAPLRRLFAQVLVQVGAQIDELSRADASGRLQMSKDRPQRAEARIELVARRAIQSELGDAFRARELEQRFACVQPPDGVEVVDRLRQRQAGGNAGVGSDISTDVDCTTRSTYSAGVGMRA